VKIGSHRAMSLARLGLLGLALSGCLPTQNQYCEGDWAAAPVEDAPPQIQRRVVSQVLPVESTAIDILFVIDDSLSMADEQAQLGIWSKELFSVLSDDGELPDLHIGVVSSSMAFTTVESRCSVGNGAFHVGSAVLEKRRYIRDVAGPNGRERNYTGTLTDTFAKMARVGDGGCGIEQPFKAARAALTVASATSSLMSAPSTTGTDGFLRPEALLLVVFVTDEDDCSATNPQFFGEDWADACSELGAPTSYRCFEHGVKCYDGKGSRVFGERSNCRPDEESAYIESVHAFADYLKRVKENPAQVIVAGIYGKPNGIVSIPDERVTQFRTPRLANVCGTGGKEGTGATPAVRMNALMAEFGGRASQSSICETELSWAMREMGLVTRAAATRSHCLRGPILDMDPTTVGIQPACTVMAARDSRDREKRDVLRPCDGTSTGERCYTFEPDPACDDTESNLAVRVETDRETLTVSCDVGADLFEDHEPRESGEERQR